MMAQMKSWASTRERGHDAVWILVLCGASMTPGGSKSSPCYIYAPHCFDCLSKTPHSSFLSSACSVITLELFWASLQARASHPLQANKINTGRDATLTSFRCKFLLNTDNCCDETGVVGRLCKWTMASYAALCWCRLELSHTETHPWAGGICRAACMPQTARQCKEVNRWGHKSLPVHLAWALTKCAFSVAFTVFGTVESTLQSLITLQAKQRHNNVVEYGRCMDESEWGVQKIKWRNRIMFHNAKDENSSYSSIASTFFKLIIF